MMRVVWQACSRRWDTYHQKRSATSEKSMSLKARMGMGLRINLAGQSCTRFSSLLSSVLCQHHFLSCHSMPRVCHANWRAALRFADCSRDRLQESPNLHRAEETCVLLPKTHDQRQASRKECDAFEIRRVVGIY